MLADHPVITDLYLTQYKGKRAAICNGTTCSNIAIPELTLHLDGSNADAGYIAAGGVYDVYLFQNGGSVIMGTSPKWPSQTALPPWANGVTDGIETNAQAIQIRYGSGPSAIYTAPIGTATFKGTIFAIANGQTSFVAHPVPVVAGPGRNGYFLGIWDADNQVDVSAYVAANSTNFYGWFYGGTAIQSRMAGNNINNRVFWVDGRARSEVNCRYDSSVGSIPSENNALGAGGTVACVLDWLPGENYFPHPNLMSQAGYTFDPPPAHGGFGLALPSSSYIKPQVGVHYISAIEFSSPVQTNFFGTQFDPSGSGSWESFSTLQLHLKM
jgi:hypothetical protein